MAFMKKFKSSRSSRKEKTKKGALSKSLPTLLEHDEIKITKFGGSFSLATGSFSPTGLVSFVPSLGDRSPSPNSHTDDSVCSFTDEEGSTFDDIKSSPIASQRILEAALSPIKDAVAPIKDAVKSHMPSTLFIRTADLPSMKQSMEHSRHSFAEIDENEWVDHLHKPSSKPPLPHIDHDENECWVALDDGNGNRAPLAEAAMSALVKTGLDAAMDEGMWTANGPTSKILKTGQWEGTTFVSYSEARSVPCPHPRGSKGESDVLVWSGSFSHKYYGYDLPAIRCEAIVNMSPKALVDLLIDSNRVKEYNKMSIGRDDIAVLHEDDKCVTKVCVGRSKPPMLGKILQLKSLIHMEELPGGGQEAGYVIISRAVAHSDDAEAAEDPKVIHSEMLMGLNVIRAVKGEPDRCILINLNHLRSPMIPMMMAKRLGLSAAVNFINDIRALC
ncbi:hypothetical protein ACHAXS_005574 [Conticribra weissflogii]